MMSSITNAKIGLAGKLETTRGLSLGAYVRVFVVGALFGVVLTKSEVVRWQRIHDMFLFREPNMYLIIGTAIAMAMVSMQVINRLQMKTIDGNPVVYVPKPFHMGVIIGGIVFGAGWAITGACPGPIFAQIGGGEPLALLTLLGAVLGMYAYAYLKPALPH
jgi:uncharacterized membrane protein YedE/YeeE